MSEFWKRKMRTYINAFDFDKDGYITEDEYVEMARRFAAAYNASDEQKDNLIRVFVNKWRRITKAAAFEKDGRLTAPVLIESIRKQMYDPGLIFDLVELIRALHRLMDVDQDGYLQSEEHQSMFRKLGVPEGTFDEKFAFEAMDTDGDGKLSIDEFVVAFLDFQFSEDETSPNKYYFGPLVD